MTTPAHNENVTRSYALHYPAHAPRRSDPHYKDFEAYRRQTVKTAKCAFGAAHADFSECAGELELHHSHVEFALQNAIDLQWLDIDYPGISDPNQVGAWVESGKNLLWLCVIEGSEVLMADGSSRAIEFVQPGEWVITHDGTAGQVEATSRKWYSGEIACFGGTAFTASHRILTDRGWLGASEIVRQVGMHGPDMIFLRGEQYEITRSVVGSIAVEMVDALPPAKRPADGLLHDVSMFENPSLFSVAPDDHADIACPVGMAPAAVSASAPLSVQSDQSAKVGTVEVGSCAPVRRAMERGSADGARPHMRWVAPVLTRTAYSGWVHDLSVPHNHSFIAGGIAVHNCEFHHRGHGGVHVASASDFEAEKYIRKLIS